MLKEGTADPYRTAEKIEGSVERVTFHSEQTGFCVLRVNVRGQRKLVTIVGHLAHVVPGEWVHAEGQWVIDREHGRQFKAELLRTLPPDSIEGITKFLGSGLIKGIGPVYAGKLVKKFGKEIFDVIEHQSAQLEKVEGIGRVRRQRIKESWVETRAIRNIMAFLMGHGVSTNRAFRIYRTYGDKAIETVRADPYCLSRDIHGIGFKSADQIAERMGIERESELRARAGIEYVLMEVTRDGHCAFPRRRLTEKAAEILEIRDAVIQEAVEHGLDSGRLVEERGVGFDEPLIYLAGMYQAEKSLASQIRALATSPHPCPPIDESKAVAWCEERVGLTLAPAQRDALCMAAREKVMILTGGPGVGKTTLVNAIIRMLAAKRLKVVLCAPTGRAAKRLSETTGCEAKTIHRLLSFDPSKGGFRHDDRHPLAGDVFVVDESSMIDLVLAWQLVRAIPRHAAMIWVGDVDQLPSVGPGMVLRDLIDTGVIPVIRLTHIFRQAAASDIITNAHRVHDGQMPFFKEKGVPSDCFFDPKDDPEMAAERVVRLVAEHIPRRFGLDSMKDIQVICPMRRGALGAQHLNRMLQDRLNPQGETIERFGYLFRVGDKVMQTQNNYDKDVFNGDMGRVMALHAEEREMKVRFEGRVVDYDLMELDELVPSYAITIHKSQGSEYPCVVIPVHTQHYVMLQRNLLYTAMTRGRRLVVLVGTQKALAIAVKRQEARRRITALRERIIALDHPVPGVF